MKTKTNIKYRCECGLDFGNKKDHWERHQNRKFPCEALAPKNTTNTPQIHQEGVFCVEINKNNELPEQNQIENNNLQCEYCLKTFSRKFSLDRHQNGRCKLKPVQPIQPVQPTPNPIQSVQPNPTPTPTDTKIDFIIKRLNLLESENAKLKKQIKRTKTPKQTNVNIDKQINNININIVNFNDFDYTGVDKKLFIQPIMNPRLFGKSIILQMIENIYINEAHPEYHNLIVTDKNRGYVKIYNNGKWKTDNINTINMIIDGIVSHSKTILVELKQQYLNNIQAKSRLNTSEKYINLCDLEHLADLEDEEINEGINNKNQIQRCKDFREMVYKDTINMFHDSKDILVKQKTPNEKVIVL